MLTIGSLFSGIGGLELGLERAGLGPVIWQCERDAYARAVLEKHWPGITRISDVRDVGPQSVERAELICGGFPCQDVSVAGKGRGLDGERSGLWREFARIIDECEPAVVVVENVTHGQRRWLPQVHEDLAELGYVPAAIQLAAADVGAPHRRARTFVLADPDGIILRHVEQWRSGGPSALVRDEREAEPMDARSAWRAALSSRWSAEPALGRVGDGIPRGLDGPAAEADAARVLANRALGNAVVPQVAEVIGRIVIEACQRA